MSLQQTAVYAAFVMFTGMTCVAGAGAGDAYDRG